MEQLHWTSGHTGPESRGHLCPQKCRREWVKTRTCRTVTGSGVPRVSLPPPRGRRGRRTRGPVVHVLVYATGPPLVLTPFLSDVENCRRTRGLPSMTSREFYETGICLNGPSTQIDEAETRRKGCVNSPIFSVKCG